MRPSESLAVYFGGQDIPRYPSHFHLDWGARKVCTPAHYICCTAKVHYASIRHYFSTSARQMLKLLPVLNGRLQVVQLNHY